MDGIDIAPDSSFSDEFGKNNKAYQELVRLRRALVRAARDIENAYESNYQRGQNAAFINASSNIKGMGFGIITNSAVDLLAYNAISNVTLRNQVKKADKQYTNDLKNLHRVTFAPYQRQLLSLMYDQYVPAAKNCFALWANEVTEKLIAYEVRYNNNAVFAEISKFNPEQSQAIVDKVDCGSSKDIICKELLEAFEKCPYNESIYLKAAKSGVIDKETYLYAAVNYGYDESIKNETKKMCSGALDNINFVKEQISYMVTYSEQEKEILEEIYAPLVSSVTKEYDALKIWINPQKYIKPFIVYDLKIQDIDDFVNMDDATIREKIEFFVFNIITEKCWGILVDNNLLGWENITLNDTSEYTSMNTYYIDILTQRIIDYQAIMYETKTRYMNASKEYKKKCNELMSDIVKLENDISQLGVFSFKKKRS